MYGPRWLAKGAGVSLMRYLPASLVITVLLGWIGISQAQLGVTAVYDQANFAVNSLTAARTLREVQLLLQELMALTDWGSILNIATQTATISGQVRDIADRLASRSDSWETPASIDNCPSTQPDMAIWNQKAVGITKDMAQETMRAQKMLERTANLLNSLISLVQTLSALVGNLQALQQLSGIMTSVSTQIGIVQGLAATFHQAMSGEMLIRNFNDLCASIITANRMQDWGTMVPRY
jgi:hypothetical protein